MVLEYNQKIGSTLIKRLNETLKTHRLSEYINISDTNWLIGFSFKNNEKNACQGMRTLFMQEMIKRGVLFQGIFVPCFTHSNNDLNYFLSAFNESIKTYNKALEFGYDNLLVGNVTKPVFRKYL